MAAPSHPPRSFAAYKKIGARSLIMLLSAAAPDAPQLILLCSSTAALCEVSTGVSDLLLPDVDFGYIIKDSFYLFTGLV